jgi:hypothetical protein
MGVVHWRVFFTTLKPILVLGLQMKQSWEIAFQIHSNTTRKMIYGNTYDFFMVPTNNFNRYKESIFIFCVDYLKQPTLKINIFYIGCLRRPRLKIISAILNN